jgi:hypothetical protein
MFLSQTEEARAELKKTMDRLIITVGRAAIEEDRTNPLICFRGQTEATL